MSDGSVIYVLDLGQLSDSQQSQLFCQHSTVGCSDFHFFSYFWKIYPSLLTLGPKSSENVKKNYFLFSLFVRIFSDFFENLYFFLTFQNQFSKSVLNQSLWNFHGIIFDK